MQHQIFTLFLSFFALSAFGQDYTEVDEHARSTPTSKETSIEKLSQHLTSKFSSEEKKVRAIYVWMADNVKYSLHTVNSRSMSIETRLKKQEPARVLKSKRAVCEGYSNLFEALCEASGIHSVIATGYTKLPDGKIAPVGHAWNLVKVDGNWRLIDATWGAGGVDGSNGKYVKSLSDEFFLTHPKEFVQHHLPHDPLFQLMSNPVSYETFKGNDNVPTHSDNNEAQLNSDLDEYFAEDKQSRQLSSSQRAVGFDKENGFANFTLSKYHYELALANYHDFFNASQKAFDKKMPLTTPMVDGWEESLNIYKKELKKSEVYLDNIRPGDPIADAAKQSKNAIRQAWKVSKETDKQFEEYRRYLKRTGR